MTPLGRAQVWPAARRAPSAGGRDPPSRGVEGVSLKVLKTCVGWSKKLPIPTDSFVTLREKVVQKVAPTPIKG